MTENHKILVQRSFSKVEPISDTAAALFYSKLFALDPSLQAMFRGDMSEQGKKLMLMLKAAVNGLDDLGALVPVVQDLGKRHVNYGVMPGHYQTVGSALIETLRDGLGEDFTPETEEAWVVVYTVLATTMQDAAYPKKEEQKKWFEFWK